jgi:hypothetical protein
VNKSSDMHTALLNDLRSSYARRLAALALVAAVTASLSSAPAASAAVYVGQLFVPTGSCAADTYLQTGVASGTGYTFPSYGHITSWSFWIGTEPVAGLTLKVARPEGGGVYTVIGESVAKTQLPNQINTYSTKIGVEPGDVLGVYTNGGGGAANCGIYGESGDTYVYAEGSWGEGTTTLFQNPVERETRPRFSRFPVQALVSEPPISSITLPECSSGTFTGGVFADYGTAPKAVHYTVNEGPELIAKASSTGAVTIKGLPPGTDILEYWAEDKAENLERVHHRVSVFVTKEKPKVNVISDQNRSTYKDGQRGSVSIHASSPHGLFFDPSAPRLGIDTSHAGLFLVPAFAIDNCGNVGTETFSYTVSPVDKGLRLSRGTFTAAHSGSSVASRAAGTVISYEATDDGSTNFAVIKGTRGVRRNGHCATGRKAKGGGKPCTRYAEEPMGEFSSPNNQGENSVRFTGRLEGRTLKPGPYRLQATPVTGGIYGPMITRTFTIVP